MGDLHLLGASFSEYDLASLSSVAYGLICQELERGDSGIRSFVSVQNSLVMFPILMWGTQDQKDHWIPKLGSGERIGCFGLTEPDFGSNPGAMRTRAVREGDGWILNGEKAWITNGSIADVAVVWARTEEGIRGFLVERGTPLPPRVGHLAAGVWGLPPARRGAVAWDDRSEESTEMSHPGPIRHRVGGDRLGDGHFHRGSELRQEPHPVR